MKKCYHSSPTAEEEAALLSSYETWLNQNNNFYEFKFRVMRCRMDAVQTAAKKCAEPTWDIEVICTKHAATASEQVFFLSFQTIQL